MPDFCFHASFDESLELLRALVDEHDVTIHTTPDAIVDEPKSVASRVVDAALAARLEHPGRAWILGPFSTTTLPFRRIESGPAAGKHTVDLQHGGPAFSFVVSRIRGRSVAMGSLEYPDEIFFGWPPRLAPPLPGHDAAFDRLVETLMQHLVHFELESVDGWVGRETLERVRRGELHLHQLGTNKHGLPAPPGGISRARHRATSERSRSMHPTFFHPTQPDVGVITFIAPASEPRFMCGVPPTAEYRRGAGVWTLKLHNVTALHQAVALVEQAAEMAAAQGERLRAGDERVADILSRKLFDWIRAAP